MPETWYVLEDGSVGDPLLISPDKKGILRHEDGRAVAYGPHGPKSRGHVDADYERAKGKKKPAKDDTKAGEKTETREMTAGSSKANYKTR